MIANKHIEVLVPPDRGGRSEPRPGWVGGRYAWMRAVLAAEHGKELYRKRMQMIEPVFAHTKHNRGINRFHRRGRIAVRTEWRLLMATHNLTKLHRHQLAATWIDGPLTVATTDAITHPRPPLTPRSCATASRQSRSLDPLPLRVCSGLDATADTHCGISIKAPALVGRQRWPAVVIARRAGCASEDSKGRDYLESACNSWHDSAPTQGAATFGRQ